MTVADTNVLSELAQLAPSKVVLDWWDRQPRNAVYITAITQAEILWGIEQLPVGKRRTALERTAKETFEVTFDRQILPFDSAAAYEFVRIAAMRRKIGRPISQADCQIAAIVRSRGAALATRNITDFEHCGIHLVNPWLHQ